MTIKQVACFSEPPYIWPRAGIKEIHLLPMQQLNTPTRLCSGTGGLMQIRTTDIAEAAKATLSTVTSCLWGSNYSFNPGFYVS